MTISGGQPHRVGYAGQDFRIVVDEETTDSTRTRRIGWTNRQDPAGLAALETRPGWSNARYERVTDKAAEYGP